MPALRFLACLLAGLLLAQAASAVPVYRVGRIFTTLDGHSQFIQIRAVEEPGGIARPVTSMRVRDASGALFAGLPISLPVPAASGSTLMVAYDPGCGLACDYVPYGDSLADYVADTMILPLGGGTIELAGADGVADAWTFPAPPVNGWTMLDRVTGAMEAVFSSRLVAPRGVDIPLLLAIEFRHHDGSYFLATRADERLALDQGRIAGWARTTHAHWVHGRASNVVVDAPGPRTVPVCRVLLTGATGVAHFMSAIASECEALRATGAVVESDAIFHAALPDPVTGACPTVLLDVEWNYSPVIAYTHAVTRFWDGKSTPPRHRLVSNQNVREAMLAQGWIAEGFGPGAVALCF